VWVTFLEAYLIKLNSLLNVIFNIYLNMKYYLYIYFYFSFENFFA